MNKRNLLFTLLVILSLTACKKNDNQNESSFKFQITGNISGIDGDSISLVIPNKGGIENRIKSVISNGKFSFHGTSEKPSAAFIRFEHDIKTNTPNYTVINLLLEPGDIKVSATLKEDQDFYRSFSDMRIMEGDNNKVFYHLIYDNVLGNHFTYINDYNNKRDSMQTNVYRQQKTLFFKKFDSIFEDKNTIAYASTLKLYLSNRLPQFDKDYFNKKDKENLTKNFRKIDSNLIDSKTYQDLKFDVESYTITKSKILFKDFKLPNKSEELISLKDIIKNNDFTVIEFWWSGCKPCRIFNKETRAIYQKLRKSNIEIVGINTDIDAVVWKRASIKDKIDWIDLYSGNKSAIENAYNVKSFPTKIIIDKNYNILNFEFKKAEELFKLVNK